jgi:cell division protein FtsQ
MLRKLLKLIGLVLLVTFVAVTLAFTSRQYRNVACRGIEVNFRDGETIQLDKADIIRMVKSADKNLIGKQLNEINSDSIEKVVEKHRAVYKAEVYKVVAKDSISYKGVLAVRVRHREPVVRVMTPDVSYFLDKNGERFPVSINYSADVLVVTGSYNFTEEYAKNELLPFVLYVKNHKFWNAQIEQVHVEKDGDVFLTPLVGDHLIELGSFENYQEKLRNMKAFYSQVLAKNNWNKYKKVSVKYKDQVIAKKR